ncbi:DUF3553 domain-containing protein [Marinobacterium sediminicola]|uniref:DUF3553 domain-containing protein n=1 Tax=Marinobacterium sediminicola TaxID=518898 RepID=A0ABY1S4R0_9GAMM|nr:DUF3553 domain-containing protein [Marinobacterium sediminicola]ULG68967.1 DUF3553 domain-containing protein [Marinobacterium sediminicola]SMR78824.1 Protein of unknown function [Marinobacterium sediminicola]
MEYKKGDRVKHPKINDWGLGEVLEDSNTESVRVFFVGVGEKVLSLKYVQPMKITGDEASHPVLDNLKINKSASGIKYQSLPQSIQFFLAQFPEGFYGKKFREHEREYKNKAHTLAQELLGQVPYDSLLETEDYVEIAKRALKIVNATNLIFPNEKMSLKDGLVEPSAQKEFAVALHSLLYGNGVLEKRFVAFAKVLEKIEAAKWTTATYFLFIVDPSKFMFVKPTITQYSSELCGFEINYKPQLNWLTYKSVLSFSEYLFSEISDLKPRDMIDVQSFMWCIAPGTYQSA